jgi:hypothetical protein
MVAIFAEDCGCAHQYLDLYVFFKCSAAGPLLGNSGHWWMLAPRW